MERRLYTRDGDDAVFQRLAQDLQGIALELRKLIQEEDAVMGETDLARAGNGAATDEGGVRERVVRSAEGARCDQRSIGREKAGDPIQLGRFQRFADGHGRQNRRQPAASIVLPEPGGPIINTL